MNNILDHWAFPYPPRENQVTALEWLAKQDAKYLLLEAPVGCHLSGTPILLYNGSIKLVEHITESDVLMGPDSTPRKIQKLISGKEQMYTISPTKGEPFVVNKNHILSLKTTKARRSGFDGNTVINISVEEYLLKSDDFKRNTKLYRSDGITFNNNHTLPIDPYFLGILLGDGTICNGQVGITTADTEILNEITHQAESHNLNVNTQGADLSAPTYYISTGIRGGDKSTRSSNTILEKLKNIGVYDTRSETKFIPQSYKIASKEARLQLLAGLIDSDGYYKSVFNICTKSQQLALDIEFVARSLGFSANHFIRTVNGTGYYDISISGEISKIPTRLPRKQASVRKQKKRVTLTSFNVIPYGIDTFYGFMLDQDHLYVMGDFTVTHNCGKSNIGVTYSHFLGERGGFRGDSFILTPQRILQEQYEESFRGIKQVNMASLYGKGNYECSKAGASCEVGSLIKPTCAHCPHTKAKNKAKKAADVVLNYRLALTSFAFTETFSERKLMVMDECHTLEDHLVGFDAVLIAEHRSKKYGLPFETQKDIMKAIEWLQEKYVPALQSKVMELEDICEPLFDKAGSDLTRAELKKIRELSVLQDHLDETVVMSIRTPSYVNDNFVLVWDKVMFQFKRLTGSHSFHKIVEPMADRFLFMSSTILNMEGFCEDLGIPLEDAAFLSLTSEFDKDNRPVFFMPQMKMNAKWKEPEQARDRVKMVDAVKQLLEMHKEDTGIIHTGNFQIAEWLTKELSGGTHRVFQHNPESELDRNSVIKEFQSALEPSVLISPSSTEGLDLKHELGRFAIFAKVPFGYLGDQWIKRRMEMSTQWYQRRALIDIIQGGGRVVRAGDDWGNVYILDESWSFLYNQAYFMIPKWWRESYSRV